MENIKELIAKHQFQLHKVNGTSQIGTFKKLSKEDVENIRPYKDEILAFLENIEAEKQAVAKKKSDFIAKIPGLAEYNNICNQWSDYRYDFDRMMETGSSRMTVKKPEVSASEVLEKYPLAKSYLKIESYQLAANYEKQSAGDEALQKLIDANGEDHEAIVASMEKRWSDYCSSVID